MIQNVTYYPTKGFLSYAPLSHMIFANKEAYLALHMKFQWELEQLLHITWIVSDPLHSLTALFLFFLSGKQPTPLTTADVLG